MSSRLNTNEERLERPEGLAALPGGDVMAGLSPHLWRPDQSVVLRLRH